MSFSNKPASMKNRKGSFGLRMNCRATQFGSRSPLREWKTSGSWPGAHHSASLADTLADALGMPQAGIDARQPAITDSSHSHFTRARRHVVGSPRPRKQLFMQEVCELRITHQLAGARRIVNAAHEDSDD